MPTDFRERRIDWRQVRLVVGLRFRLMFRDARKRPVAFALRTLAALGVMGLFTFLGVAAGVLVYSLASRGATEQALTAVHLVYLCGFLWLALGPLLAFRADEFLDVTKLFVHPVNHRTVFAASLLSACVTPTAFMAFAPLAAVSVGLAGGVAAVLGRLVLTLALVGVAVLSGQVVLLLLLNTLRSRVWRDVMLVLGPCIGAAVFVLFQVGSRQAGGGVAAALDVVHGMLGYLAPLPSWWAATAAGAESWAGVLPALGLPLLAWWLVGVASRLQERAFHGELWSAVPERSRTAGRQGGRFRFLPDPIGALADKDLKLLFREPVVRMLLIQQGAWALFPVGLAAWRTFQVGGGEITEKGLRALPFLPLAALFMLLLEVSLLLNVLGLEGGGIQHTLLRPVRSRHLLWGKAWCHLVFFGTINAVVAAALALAGFGWIGAWGEGIGRALLGAALAYTVTAVALALGIPASVHFPVRLAVRGKRALRAQSVGKEGCLAGLKHGLATAAMVFAFIPLVALVHHADLLALRSIDLGGWAYLTVPAGVIVAAGVAAVALRAGVAAGAASMDGRAEFLLERLAKADD